MLLHRVSAENVRHKSVCAAFLGKINKSFLFFINIVVICLKEITLNQRCCNEIISIFSFKFLNFCDVFLCFENYNRPK